VESDWRLIYLGHMETLYDGGAEGGVGTACEKFVEFDEEAGVWVVSFDGLH